MILDHQKYPSKIRYINYSYNYSTIWNTLRVSRNYNAFKTDC